MPLSSTTYTGNGVTTQFSVPFLYVRQDDVTASIDDVPTTFTWVDASNILFSTAPDTGAVVKIERHTDTSELAVDFIDASNLTEADLDKQYRHTLFYVQELKELFDFYIDFWNDGVISGGDLPTSSGANSFIVGDGSGGWDVKTLAETKTILGLDDLADVTGLPEPTGSAGFVFTDGDNWFIKGIKPTRAALNLGDLAVHNIDDFPTLLLDSTKVVLVDDDGLLPAVDGSLLTNVARPKYALFWESAAYNVGGGTYSSDNVWAPRTLTDEVVDEIGCTLASGNVTVPAGKYAIRVRSKVQVQGHCLCRLITSDGVSVVGKSDAIFNNDDEQEVELYVEDTFTGSRTLRVDVYCTGAGSDGNALGKPHNTSGLGNNIYTRLEFWKLPE